MADIEEATCGTAESQDASLLREDQAEAPVPATRRRWRILAASLVVGALLCCAVASKKLLADSQRVREASHGLTKEGMLQSWVLPQPGQERWTPANNKILWIGVFTAPAYFSRRAALRSDWVTQTQQDYAGRIDVQFIIGQVPINHNEFKKLPIPIASPEDIEIERKIQAEMKQYGDILRIPTVEGYQFLPIKSLQLFALGARSGAKYVLKIDDDMHFHPGHFITWAEQRAEAGKTAPAYFGPYQIQNAVKQANGKFDKFMYGPCYGVSGDLAWQIAIADFDHSIAFPMYGSPMDDANMGIWETYENQQRLAQGLPGIDVEVTGGFGSICSPGPQGLDPTGN